MLLISHSLLTKRTLTRCVCPVSVPRLLLPSGELSLQHRREGHVPTGTLPGGAGLRR